MVGRVVCPVSALAFSHGHLWKVAIFARIVCPASAFPFRDGHMRKVVMVARIVCINIPRLTAGSCGDSH